jgi:hypothetical protein
MPRTDVGRASLGVYITFAPPSAVRDGVEVTSVSLCASRQSLLQPGSISVRAVETAGTRGTSVVSLELH